MRFVSYAVLLVSTAASSSTSTSRSKPASSGYEYEVWASDQESNNSVPLQSALGVKGSFQWICHSDEDIEEQLNTSPSKTSPVVDVEQEKVDPELTRKISQPAPTISRSSTTLPRLLML